MRITHLKKEEDKTMFSKVLVATDVSEASDHVINCLHQLRPLGLKEVVLANALGIKHLDALKYELTRLVEPRLSVQKQNLEKQGFATKIEIGPGLPSYEINRIAEKENVSLIALGTHGMGLTSHLLGGMASEIIHSATKPLLIIRLIVKEEGGIPCSELACLDLGQSLLYATDFSDTAHRAFSYIEKMVESGWKKVTLMHVQDIVKIGKHLENRLEESKKIDQERLEMLKAKLIEKGAKQVKIALPYGAPISEILKESQQDNYSLIVMGSQGSGFIKEIFLGSVSHNLVRLASLPVLLIPALRQ
jgi:nucleotide-binding universal stress UspA family protein